MTPTTQITADDLRAERTWLVQHGVHELTCIAGHTLLSAVREVDRQVKDLNAEIARMEGGK